MNDILLLEDDRLLAQSIVEELTHASYGVIWVQEGDEAAELLFEQHFKLYLFDVNVPGMNGFELLRGLRESGDATPAIFLTSRSGIDDIKTGFDAGAADYIKKPFDLGELLVRIEAKMPRRTCRILSNSLAIDRQNMCIICGSEHKRLRVKEFELLEYFAAHPGQLLHTEAIMHAVYAQKPITIATFRTYIKNLKRHIEGHAAIENIKGVGYRFSIV